MLVKYDMKVMSKDTQVASGTIRKKTVHLNLTT